MNTEPYLEAEIEAARRRVLSWWREKQIKPSMEPIVDYRPTAERRIKPKARQIYATVKRVRAPRLREIAARKPRPITKIRDAKPDGPKRPQGRPSLPFVLSRERLIEYWSKGFHPNAIAADLKTTRRVVAKRIAVFLAEPEFAERVALMMACSCGRAKWPYKQRCARCTSGMGLVENSERKDVTLDLIIPMLQAGKSTADVAAHFGVEWHIINRRLKGGRLDPRFADAIKAMATCAKCGGRRNIGGVRDECAKCLRAAKRMERRAA